MHKKYVYSSLFELYQMLGKLEMKPYSNFDNKCMINETFNRV